MPATSASGQQLVEHVSWMTSSTRSSPSHPGHAGLAAASAASARWRRRGRPGVSRSTSRAAEWGAPTPAALRLPSSHSLDVPPWPSPTRSVHRDGHRPAEGAGPRRAAAQGPEKGPAGNGCGSSVGSSRGDVEGYASPVGREDEDELDNAPMRGKWIRSRPIRPRSEVLLSLLTASSAWNRIVVMCISLYSSLARIGVKPMDN